MQPLPYDYYGEYGIKKNDPDPYCDQLVKDYTFDFPKQHHMVCHTPLANMFWRYYNTHVPL